MVGVALGLCGLVIENNYSKWQMSPVKTNKIKNSISETIPFPTITICPEIKTMKSRFDLTSTLKSQPLSNLSEER